MTKTLSIGALIVVALVVLIWWGAPSSSGNVPSAEAEIPLLSGEPRSFDFGTISMKNGTVETRFHVVNESEEAIVLTNIETSCMCTTAYLENDSSSVGPFGMPGHGGATTAVNDTVLPGEERVLRVVYDPAAHGPAGIGPVDRMISVTDTRGRVLSFNITALVTP